MAHVKVDYKVIEAGDPETLRGRVRTCLIENWMPQGGVVVVALGDDHYLYAQAMTFCVGDNT